MRRAAGKILALRKKTSKSSFTAKDMREGGSSTLKWREDRSRTIRISRWGGVVENGSLAKKILKKVKFAAKPGANFFILTLWGAGGQGDLMYSTGEVSRSPYRTPKAESNSGGRWYNRNLQLLWERDSGVDYTLAIFGNVGYTTSFINPRDDQAEEK